MYELNTYLKHLHIHEGLSDYKILSNLRECKKIPFKKEDCSTICTFIISLLTIMEGYVERSVMRIEFDRDGNLYIGPDRKMLMTEAAYNLIRERNISHLQELGKDFYLIPIETEMLALSSEVPQDVQKALGVHKAALYDIMMNIYKKHPDLVRKHYNSFEEVKDAAAKMIGKDKDAAIIHATAIEFLSNHYPVWKVYELTSEAAMLVMNAKIDDEATLPYVDKVAKGIYVKAKKDCLFGAVSEIMLSKSSQMVGFKIANNWSTFSTAMLHEAMFCTKLLALLDCERTPLLVDGVAPNNGTSERRTGNSSLKKKGPRTVTISLTERYSHTVTKTGEGHLDKDGLVKTVVSISGFIRTQHYGPGRSQKKQIWIDGFMRGQWVKEGPTFVSVKE